MQDFIASGRFADLVLVVMALEAAVLLLRRRAGMLDVLCALAPGALLVLALRAAVTGADWRWVAFFVAASLPFHLADLARRRL
jgi:hypothetical protein